MNKRDKRLKTIKKIKKLAEKMKKVYICSPIYNEEVNITLRWNRYCLAIGNKEDTTGEIYTF